jgi:type I restriction enzyme R subunit
VLEQAKRYAKGAFSGPGNWDGYRVPFLYSSNGEVIWFFDVRSSKNIARTISQFHSPDALKKCFECNTSSWHEWLEANPVDIEGLRPYKKDAIQSMEKALVKGKRSMLVAMATGTGKTFVTVSQIYRLLTSKASRRILFLVDRRALAAQAVREFASFNTPRGNKFDQEYEVYSQRFKKGDFGEDEPFDPKVLPNAYLTAPSATHTFVYVSTIQRMTINLFGREGAFPQDQSDPDYENDAEPMDIPIHAPSTSSSPMNAIAAIPPQRQPSGGRRSNISMP